jgi:hypothetical protein
VGEGAGYGSLGSAGSRNRAASGGGDKALAIAGRALTNNSERGPQWTSRPLESMQKPTDRQWPAVTSTAPRRT